MELKTLLKEVVVQPSGSGVFVAIRQETAVFDGENQVGSNGETETVFALSGDQAQQVASALEAQKLWPDGAELVSCNVFPRDDGAFSVSVASRVPLVENGELLGYGPTVRGVVSLTKKKQASVTALIESFGVSLG